VSSFEYLFVNGVPHWGPGGLRTTTLMLSSEPRGASSVCLVSRRRRQALYWSILLTSAYAIAHTESGLTCTGGNRQQGK
jgi:hypothetical protein